MKRSKVEDLDQYHHHSAFLFHHQVRHTQSSPTPLPPRLPIYIMPHHHNHHVTTITTISRHSSRSIIFYISLSPSSIDNVFLISLRPHNTLTPLNSSAIHCYNTPRHRACHITHSFMLLICTTPPRRLSSHSPFNSTFYIIPTPDTIHAPPLMKSSNTGRSSKWRRRREVEEEKEEAAAASDEYVVEGGLGGVRVWVAEDEGVGRTVWRRGT